MWLPFKKPKRNIVYPFRGLIAALRDKDDELFSRIGHLSPSAFVVAWRETYPEDFPYGGASPPHESMVMPRIVASDRG